MSDDSDAERTASQIDDDQNISAYDSKADSNREWQPNQLSISEPSEDMFFGNASYQATKNFANSMVDVSQDIKRKAIQLEKTVQQLLGVMKDFSQIRWKAGSFDCFEWLDFDTSKTIEMNHR